MFIRNQPTFIMLVTLVAAMGFAGRTYAQSGVSTGSILGTVKDSSGAALPQAQITATNVNSGYRRTLESQGDGSYQILLLPPGNYSLSVSKSGFKTIVRTGLSLAVDHNLRVDLTLVVGSTTESITVTGAAIQINTQTSQVSSVVSQTQLADLPIAGNRFLVVTNTSPGVIPVDQGYGVNVNPIYNLLGTDAEAAGAFSEYTDYQIDSSSYRLNIWGGSPNMPSSQTVQEVNVVRNDFSAQYGTGAALVVDAVTKSGTNELHGSAYDTFGSAALDSRCFICASTSPPLTFYHQVGGDIGGPVVLPHIYNGKDRSFFFFDYETFRQPATPNTLSGATPPTPAEKNGDFSALLPTEITDPDTGQPFPRNMIPTSRIDPVAAGIMQLMPPANYGNQLRENYPLTAEENQFTIRGDQNLGSKDHLFGRVFWDVPQSLNTTGTMLVYPDGHSVQEVRNKSLTLNNNYILSPTLLNQTAFAWMRDVQLQTTPGIYTQTNMLGIQNWDIGNLGMVPPNIQIPGYGISIQAFDGLTEQDHNDLLSDTLSWIKGRHSLKFGGEYGRWTALQAGGVDGNGASNGSFTFDGSFTGNGLADFVIGRPSVMSRASSIPVNLVTTTFAAFAQDDFKATRRLTLNLGLRYQFQNPYKSTKGYGGVFIEGQQSRVIPNAPLGLNYVGDPGVPAGFYKTAYDDFAPRIGFAYDPTGSGSTSIRGGWGVYYNLESWQAAADTASTAPYGVSVDFVPASLSNPFGGVANPFPYVFSSRKATFIYPVTINVLDTRVRPSYLETWNFGVQHQIKGIVVEADYVGNEGHDIMAPLQINPAKYIPGTNAAGQPLSTLENIQQRRIILPEYYAGITQITDFANSNYQALQISGVGHLTRSLMLTTAWTWGHCLNNGGSFGRTVDDDTTNPYDTQADKGNCDFDFRHIFTTSVVWNLPKLASFPALARSILGGWAFSSLFTAQSGGFSTIFSGEDRSLTGIGNDEAVQVLPRSQWISPGNRGQQLLAYFNGKAFALAPIGTFGNTGHNDAQMPGLWNDDLSVMKNFLVGERVTVRVRGDLYNAFNHPTLGNCHANWGCAVYNGVSDTDFGEFWATGPGRTVQLGFSINF